jgi:hypothetical protein
MVWDLTVVMEDRPGTGVDLGAALEAAGVTIRGGCAYSQGGKGIAHLLVEDADAARGAIEAAGIEVAAQRRVLLVDLGDAAEATWEIPRRTSGAGVNIELMYLAFDGGFVIGVDDLDKGREALS